jgi:phosphoadenosine phosphosulfate reductase
MYMGIRSQESSSRAKRWSEVTTHFKHGSTVVNPCFDWDDSELWEFIRGESVPYSSLYDEGFHRLGCIGCPMARTKGKLAEFARWPKYQAKWMRVFERVWERKAGTKQRDGRQWFGSARFGSWLEMWEWWLYETPMPQPFDDKGGLFK